MTNDLDTEIRSGLEHLASSAAPTGVASDDVLGRIAERRTARRRMRRAGAAICVVAVLGGSAAFAATTELGSDESQIATEPDVVTDTSLPPDTTTSVPEDGEPDPAPDDPDEATTGSEAPLSPRNHSATAWTGTELVLWGGAETYHFSAERDLFNDGAAYDPTTNTWRAMTPGPIDRQTHRPVAVSTDAGVMVFSGRASAAWDPSSNTWRGLPDAPVEVGDAVWTGEEVIVARSSTLTGQPDFAALDPQAGIWRDLTSPAGLEETVILWTGDEVIVLGREVGFSLGNVEGQALDPSTNTWRDLPTGPLLARGFGATWVEDRVMVVNYRSEAASYDPSTDTWTALPALPTSFGEVGTVPIAIGEHVVINAGGFVFVGDRFGTWTPLAPPRYWYEHVVSISDDSALLVMFQAFDQTGDLDPAPPVVEQLHIDDLLDPEALWFGLAELVLGDDIAFERQELIGDASQWQHTGVVTTVRVDNEECTITQRYGETVVGTPNGDPIEIVPLHGGQPWTGYLQDGGRTIRLPEGSPRLECEDPTDTMTLARAVVRDEAAIEADQQRVEQEQRELAEREQQRERLEELQRSLDEASRRAEQNAEP